MNSEQLNAISSYFDQCQERKRLEKTISQLQKQLTDAAASEERGLAAIAPFCSGDNLVTGPALRQINKLLSSPCSLRHREALLPVANAKLKSGSGSGGRDFELLINFSRPIFRGWKTEKPYNFQMLPLSPVVPPAPSEQHIAQYLESGVEQRLELLYWEHVNGELLLYCKPGYSGEERIVRFVLDGGAAVTPRAVPSVESAAQVEQVEQVERQAEQHAEQQDEFAAWLKLVTKQERT